MECKEFKCKELSPYVDSMLFESGTVIARGTFEHNGKSLDVTLEVRGDVAVTFKNEVYHNPIEFPDELIERIKAHPNDWEYYSPSGEGNDEPEGDVYIGLNNWFEYIYDIDGEVYEQDLSKATPESIKEEMEMIAAQYFGIDGCYGSGSDACINYCHNCA